MPERQPIRVTDLRGTSRLAPTAVLSDPSGRRAALLHQIGRVVGSLFLLWLVCLVLAGLGLLPSAGIPLASGVSSRNQPAPLASLPRPTPASGPDLRPASAVRGTRRAVGTGTASATAGRRQSVNRRTPAGKGGRSVKHPGSANGTLRPATNTNGLANPPGLTSPTTSTHSASPTAPGQTKTTTSASPTKSASAPGQTKTTPSATTSPGQSGSAPGHTRTDTTAHGPPPR